MRAETIIAGRLRAKEMHRHEKWSAICLGVQF